MGLKNRYLGSHLSHVGLLLSFSLLASSLRCKMNLWGQIHFMLCSIEHITSPRWLIANKKLIKVASFLAYSFYFIIKSKPEISVILITCSVSFS